MTNNPKPHEVTVTIDSRERLEMELDRAFDQVIVEALKEGNRGILVTRRNHRTYTVELSAEVPFGTVVEAEANTALSALVEK